MPATLPTNIRDAQGNPVSVAPTMEVDETGARVQTAAESSAELLAKMEEVRLLLVELNSAANDEGAVPTFPYPGAPKSGQTAAMTGVDSVQLLAAPGAGLHNFVTSIIVSNTDATPSEVELLDGAGGTVLLCYPGSSDNGGAIHALPTPLFQPTANTALHVRNTVTGASVKVGVVGYAAAAPEV